MRYLPAVALVIVIIGTSLGAAAAGDRPIAGDRLRLRDPVGHPERRKVRFRTVRDLAIDPVASPDPRIFGATLEIAGSRPGDGASGPIVLAAGLWKGLDTPRGRRGYRWHDPAGSSGVRIVVLRFGRRGGGVTVSGGTAAWPYALTQPQGTIDVRITIRSDVYCAKFTTLTVDGAERVVGRAAPAPVDCTPGVCGDGLVQASEECDDGNVAGGDGCSAVCELEDTSARCAGMPAVAGTQLEAVRVAAGLDRPLHLTAPPLDPRRVFVVEQLGRIRIIKDGTLVATPFLAIENKVSCCGERGLLSLAFHPDYETNGRFFVYYTNRAGQSVLARYQMSSDPDLADAASEIVLLTIAPPTASHQGGLNVFGPDGYLYVGVGDGTPPDDPVLETTAQDDTTLLGKLLRLDVDVESPPYYARPPGNPNPTAPDPLNLVWAKGLRNPWRFSFDRLTGDLYLGDVGEHSWEEIDLQAAGAAGLNYGWDIFEGRHCFEPAPLLTDCPDPPTGYVMPVLEYDHDTGCAVTGGFVYRGCAMPELRGRYFFSDFCAGFVRTFDEVSGGEARNLVDRTPTVTPAAATIDFVRSFGEDARGELYLVADGGFFPATGQVFKLVPGR